METHAQPSLLALPPKPRVCNDCSGLIERLQKNTSDSAETPNRLGDGDSLELKPSVQYWRRSASNCRSCSFFFVHAESMIERMIERIIERTKSQSRLPEAGMKVTLGFSFLTGCTEDNVFGLTIGPHKPDDINDVEGRGYAVTRYFAFFTSHGKQMPSLDPHTIYTDP
jgi:hypothetical protein